MDVVTLGAAKSATKKTLGQRVDQQGRRLRFNAVSTSPVLLASAFSIPKIYSPSLVYVRDMIPGAPADYALVVSSNHALDNSDGIYLTWVGNPADPTTYTPVGRVYQDRVVGISTETPEIIRVPELGLFYMYYQQSGAGNNQSTLLAVSSDLITWERIGIVIDYTEGTMPGDGHTGNYGTTMRNPNGLWTSITLMGGTTYGRRTINYSVDGVRWHMDPYPITTSQDTNRDQRLFTEIVGYFSFNGSPWGIGTIGLAAAGEAEKRCQLVAGPVTADYRHWLGQPQQVFTPSSATESADLQSIKVSAVGDSLFMFLAIGNDVRAYVGEAY